MLSRIKSLFGGKSRGSLNDYEATRMRVKGYSEISNISSDVRVRLVSYVGIGRYIEHELGSSDIADCEYIIGYLVENIGDTEIEDSVTHEVVEPNGRFIVDKSKLDWYKHVYFEGCCIVIDGINKYLRFDGVGKSDIARRVSIDIQQRNKILDIARYDRNNQIAGYNAAYNRYIDDRILRGLIDKHNSKIDKNRKVFEYTLSNIVEVGKEIKTIIGYLVRNGKTPGSIYHLVDGEENVKFTGKYELAFIDCDSIPIAVKNGFKVNNGDIINNEIVQNSNFKDIRIDGGIYEGDRLIDFHVDYKDYISKEIKDSLLVKA